MKTLVATLLGIPIAVPMLFGGQHQLGRADVERALLRQMNGSAAGQITRRVDCAAAGRSKHPAFTCALTGVNGTREQATVFVNGSAWRAQWAPLKG